MTLGRFVIKNVLRNKRRSAFTAISIGFSLFMVILLRTVVEEVLDPTESSESPLRLAVRNKSMVVPLPMAHRQKILDLPGVDIVIPLQYFGGIYRDPKNFFVNFATDPDQVWDIWTEFKIDPAVRKKFAETRDGCVVGEELMEKFGWKVGDRVTLKGTIFPMDLDFVIVGTYWSDMFNGFYFQYAYFNEALKAAGNMGMPNQDYVSNFWVRAKTPEEVPKLIEAIDGAFKNTTFETMTETEKAFRINFLSNLGNIKTLARALISVVVFTMILVAGSTMAMTLRERTREIGILKSLGFQRRTLLLVTLGEALVIAFIGFALAALGSLTLGQLDFRQASFGFVESLSARAESYGYIALVALATAFVGGLIPSLRAANMTITEALRRSN